LCYNYSMKVICTQCGKQFDKKPSEAKKYKKHFCARDCYVKWQRENLTGPKYTLMCDCCGKSFERRKSAGKRKHSFCSRKCQHTFFRGQNSPQYKNGRYTDDRGYVLVYTPKHPRRVAKCYVYEHILVMEKALGRYLEKGEVVHHLNGDRENNRIENLQVMSQAEHRKLHTNANET
jgi:hypothetical protein